MPTPRQPLTRRLVDGNGQPIVTRCLLQRVAVGSAVSLPISMVGTAEILDHVSQGWAGLPVMGTILAGTAAGVWVGNRWHDRAVRNGHACATDCAL